VGYNGVVVRTPPHRLWCRNATQENAWCRAAPHVDVCFKLMLMYAKYMQENG